MASPRKPRRPVGRPRLKPLDRHCGMCKEWKTADCFYGPTMSYCKPCAALYQKGRRRGEIPARLPEGVKIEKPDPGSALTPGAYQDRGPRQKDAKFLARMPPISNTIAPMPANIEIAPTDFAAKSGITRAMAAAEMIGSGTEKGRKIIEFWVRILYDEKCDLKTRVLVAKELADRFFGKVPTEVRAELSMSGREVNARIGGLSDEELAGLDKSVDFEKYVTMDAISRQVEDVLAQPSPKLDEPSEPGAYEFVPSYD